MKIGIVPAVGVQLDAAGQIGRRVIVLDQIVQADREGLVDGVGRDFRICSANGDGVSRQGIGVEQRSIGDSNFTRVGVDLERSGDALRLNRVGDRSASHRGLHRRSTRR